jgi:hypothetical protein
MAVGEAQPQALPQQEREAIYAALQQEQRSASRSAQNAAHCIQKWAARLGTTARRVQVASRARAALLRPVPPVVVERIVGPRRACDTGWRLLRCRLLPRNLQRGLGRARLWHGGPVARVRCGAGPPMMSRRRTRPAVRRRGGKSGRRGAWRRLGWQGPTSVGGGGRAGAEHSGRERERSGVVAVIPDGWGITGSRTAGWRRRMGRRRRRCRRRHDEWCNGCRPACVRAFARGRAAAGQCGRLRSGWRFVGSRR